MAGHIHVRAVDSVSSATKPWKNVAAVTDARLGAWFSPVRPRHFNEEVGDRLVEVPSLGVFMSHRFVLAGFERQVSEGHGARLVS